jgi:hypothetical protein
MSQVGAIWRILRLVFDQYDDLGTVASVFRYLLANQICLGIRPHAGPRGCNGDMERLRLDNPIEVPRVLSMLTWSRWTAEVKGLDKIPSVITELADPTMILCRSNGGAMSQVMSQMAARLAGPAFHIFDIRILHGRKGCETPR